MIPKLVSKVVKYFMICLKIWYEVGDWSTSFSKLPDVSEFSNFWFQTYSLIVRCFEKKSGNSNRPRSLSFSFGFQQTNREAEGARCVVGWIDRWLHEWTDIQVSFKVSCVLDKYMFKSFLFFFNGFEYLMWIWRGRTPFSIFSTFFYYFVPNLFMNAGCCTLTYSLPAPARDSQESHEVRLCTSHTKYDRARNTTCFAKKVFLVVVI